MIMPARRISREEVFEFKYSICTLASRPTEYDQMVESFAKAGFTETDCEFMYSDNSKSNEFEAFAGFNRFLREAKGEFVIICHQDVLISPDNRSVLEEQINKVNNLDPNWGVLGNAGINNMYLMSMVVTEADMVVHRKGTLPSKVYSLDENFIVLKASANLAVSGDLDGFHMYGTDICLVAECLGYSAYAIDFNIIHKGLGIVDESFHILSDKLKKKYSRFFRGRYVRTTITRFYVSSSPLINSVMNTGLFKSISRLYYKVKYSIDRKI